MLERAKVSGRSDDNEETIRHRLVEYAEKTLPVADYYRQQGKEILIDGTGDIEEISERIEQKLKGKN